MASMPISSPARCCGATCSVRHHPAEHRAPSAPARLTPGVAAFTLRALADELDVGPTALYNHVSNREELLGAIAERFVAGLDLSRTADGHWPQWVRAVAADLRRQMLDHPHRAELMLSRAPGSPAGRTFLDDFLDELESAGVHRATAHAIWHLVLALVIGMAQIERHHGADPADTFGALLDLAMEGVLAAATRPPGDHTLALLEAHPHAQSPARP